MDMGDQISPFLESVALMVESGFCFKQTIRKKLSCRINSNLLILIFVQVETLNPWPFSNRSDDGWLFG